MRDNFDELKDIFNRELKSISVSEELKFKTLEKCMKHKRNLIQKGFIPIALSVAACLFFGIIIYPIYNKSSLIVDEAVALKRSNIDIKPEVEPSINAAMLKDKDNITGEENKKIASNSIVDENQKADLKNSKKQTQEKDNIALENKALMQTKIDSSIQNEKKYKDVPSGATIQKEIPVEDNNTSIELAKDNEENFNSEVKMKTLSIQQVKDISGNSIIFPYYIPKDFVLDKVLVPEYSNNPYELYEIIYSNNSQHFKVTQYKNINNSIALGENITQELNEEEKNIMIINIKNIPVKYIISESVDNKELPHVKLFFENDGKEYRIEGNLAWAELINVAYSIIR